MDGIEFAQVLVGSRNKWTNDDVLVQIWNIVNAYSRYDLLQGLVDLSWQARAEVFEAFGFAPADAERYKQNPGRKKAKPVPKRKKAGPNFDDSASEYESSDDDATPDISDKPAAKSRAKPWAKSEPKSQAKSLAQPRAELALPQGPVQTEDCKPKLETPDGGPLGPELLPRPRRRVKSEVKPEALGPVVGIQGVKAEAPPAGAARGRRKAEPKPEAAVGAISARAGRSRGRKAGVRVKAEPMPAMVAEPVALLRARDAQNERPGPRLGLMRIRTKSRPRQARLARGIM